MTSIPQQPAAGQVIVGVDTHKHQHVAVALNQLGGMLGQLTIPADTGGYAQLARWAATLGRMVAFGVEAPAPTAPG